MENALLSDNIKHFRQLESTNTFAAKWLGENSPDEGSVVLADFQTFGKGVGENTWESEDRKNLLMSIILYPHFLDAGDQFLLNKIISLSVLGCVEQFTGAKDVSIKWPNDIYVGKNKIAGILSRNTVSGSQLDSSIIGIGLNVNQCNFSDSVPNPVSMKLITGEDNNINLVLLDLLTNIAYYYTLLKKGNHHEIDALYLDHLLNFNIEARYQSGGEIFSSVIKGVSKYGRLQMKMAGKIKEFDMKEIQFVFE